MSTMSTMNTWTISLPQVGPIVPSQEVRSYDLELDNVASVLNDICESLSENGSVRFLVSGFGQKQWPVDIYTDLAVVVEQVPAVLKALRNGKSAILGFYEQGIQRVLSMDPAGVETIVECQSMTSWQPEPSAIRMESAKLLEMLETFLDEFVDRGRQCCPAVVRHPWFREWLGEDLSN